MGGLLTKLAGGYPLRSPGMVSSPHMVDLNRRTPIQNPDGSVSTERSFSFDDGKNEVVIPQIVDGVDVGQQGAIDSYFKTGRNLGKFKQGDYANADAWAQRVHEAQGKRYKQGQKRSYWEGF